MKHIWYSNTIFQNAHLRICCRSMKYLVHRVVHQALLQLDLPKASQVLCLFFCLFVSVLFLLLHRESSRIASPRVFSNYVCVKSLSQHDNESDLNNSPYRMHNATSNSVFSNSPNMHFTCMVGRCMDHLHLLLTQSQEGFMLL